MAEKVVSDPQEIFNIVAKHLLEMKERSGKWDTESGEFICKYRGPNGGKCAVGILIPDSLYKDYFDSVCFLEDIIDSKEEFSGWRPNIELLLCLQCLHDGKNYWDMAPWDTRVKDFWHSRENKIQLLKEVAEFFGLNYSVLEQQ